MRLWTLTGLIVSRYSICATTGKSARPSTRTKTSSFCPRAFRLAAVLVFLSAHIRCSTPKFMRSCLASLLAMSVHKQLAKRSRLVPESVRLVTTLLQTCDTIRTVTINSQIDVSLFADEKKRDMTIDNSAYKSTDVIVLASLLSVSRVCCRRPFHHIVSDPERCSRFISRSLTSVARVGRPSRRH